MEDLHANRLDMQQAVLGVIDTHADAWAEIPAMQDYRDALAGLIDAARKAAQAQTKTSKPATASKKKLRAKVTGQSWRLAQAIKAWGRATRQPEIAAAVNLSKTEFNHLRDAALAAFSEVVVSEARKHLPAPEDDPKTKLGRYGVTAAVVDALDATDDEFARALSTPRLAIVARKGATRAIATTVSQAQTLLDEEIDPTVDFLSADQPAFAQAYRDARIIVDQGSGPSAPGDEDPPETP